MIEAGIVVKYIVRLMANICKIIKYYYYSWIFTMTFQKSPSIIMSRVEWPVEERPTWSELSIKNHTETANDNHPWSSLIVFSKPQVLVKLKQNLWAAALHWTNTVIKILFCPMVCGFEMLLSITRVPALFDVWSSIINTRLSCQHNRLELDCVFGKPG